MLKHLTAAAFVFSTSAAAHELTPTYPEFKPSYVEGVAVTTMSIWNRRQDVSYYEIQVFDQDWNPIQFAAEAKLIQMSYLEKKNFQIYLRESDLNTVEYICTVSKLLTKDVESTGVTSRICSRVK